MQNLITLIQKLFNSKKVTITSDSNVLINTSKEKTGNLLVLSIESVN